MRLADILTIFLCRLSWNLWASTSWNPHGLVKVCIGVFVPFTFQNNSPHYWHSSTVLNYFLLSSRTALINYTMRRDFEKRSSGYYNNRHTYTLQLYLKQSQPQCDIEFNSVTKHHELRPVTTEVCTAKQADTQQLKYQTSVVWNRLESYKLLKSCSTITIPRANTT